jgi:hypothetical protein
VLRCVVFDMARDDESCFILWLLECGFGVNPIDENSYRVIEFVGGGF